MPHGIRIVDVIHGVIGKYRDDKGYGYIITDDGRHPFFHIKGRGVVTVDRDYPTGQSINVIPGGVADREPIVGDRVVFHLKSETQGLRATPWVPEWLWQETIDGIVNQRYRVVRVRTGTREPSAEGIFDGTLDELVSQYPTGIDDLLAPVERSGFKSTCRFYRLVDGELEECADPRPPAATRSRR